MGLFNIIKNLINDLRGACPNCHAFSETERTEGQPYERPFQLEAIKSTEKVIPWEERCKTCGYLSKKGETSDITSRECSDDRGLGWEVHDWDEYYKKGEYIGTANVRTYKTDPR